MSRTRPRPQPEGHLLGRSPRRCSRLTRTGALGGLLVDGFDVVAVRVADERTGACWTSVRLSKPWLSAARAACSVRWVHSAQRSRIAVPVADFVRALDRHRVAGSIWRVGAAGDNAAMESFISLLHKNVLNRRSWATRQERRNAIVTWIERTYHRRRRQASLGRLTHVEFNRHNHTSPRSRANEPVTPTCISPLLESQRHSTQGAHRPAGRRDRGQARSVAAQHQNPARQTHRRQTPAARRPRADLGG